MKTLFPTRLVRFDSSQAYRFCQVFFNLIVSLACTFSIPYADCLATHMHPADTLPAWLFFY
jgi:hypothetical protein